MHGVLLISTIILVMGFIISFWWCVVHYLVVPFVLPLFMNNPIISSTQEWGIVILIMLLVAIFNGGRGR